jgi:hypothetical protein
MWDIRIEQNEHSISLDCIDCSIPAESIDHLYIQHILGEKVIFTVTVDPFKIQAITNQLLEITHVYTEAYTLTIHVPITENLLAFTRAIDVLRSSINDFGPIESSLTNIIKPSKFGVLQTSKAMQNNFVTAVEKLVDNTQRACVFTSARKSELLLRERFEFEMPDYQITEVEEIAFSVDDPEAVAIAAAVADADAEAYDYAEHDTSEYSDEENNLIESLLQRLNKIQDDFISRDYLEEITLQEEDGPVNIIWITDKSKTLINLSEAEKQAKIAAVKLGAESDEEEIKKIYNKIHNANFALDICAAIRALSSGGSHSHNGNMAQTKITGYGMRNVVALMWHACLEARKESSGFMENTNFHQAFQALVHGIADGARGKNRNDGEEDNLQPKDLRVCDQGRYNSLISSLNGFLKEINITYDILELLLSQLKTEILMLLVADESIFNLDTAHQYLNLWLGYDTSEPPVAYVEFRQIVNSEFDNMKSRFLDKFCSHSPELRAAVAKELNDDMVKIQASSMGCFSFIDQVSPTHEELDQLWFEYHADMELDEGDEQEQQEDQQEDQQGARFSPACRM